MPSYIVTAAEYIALPRAPETWLVENLIPASGSALLYGDPKVGKSFAALQLASSLTTGSPWLGFRTKPAGPVVYIQLDTPRSLWAERMENVKRAGVNLDDICMADLGTLDTFPFDILNPAHFERLQLSLQSIAPSAVIIDTVREAHEGDENDSTAMKIATSKFYAAVQPSALILISHARKFIGEGGPDLVNDNRGSNYLVGKMDAIIRFTPKTAHYLGRAIEGGRINCERTDAGLWHPILAEVDDAIEAVLADSSLTTDTARAKVLASKLKRSEQAARRLLQRRK